MAYTQDDLDAIDAIIQAKISSGSIAAGSFSIGGISINEGTSLERLFKIRAEIQGIIDGDAGTITVAMKLKGVD